MGWPADGEDDPIPEHKLAACTGRGGPARASDAFVGTTADSFAASLDTVTRGGRVDA